ncbi:MAG: hypothetical protein AB7O96_16810 [Pseudobdellovibrionaceae bacterium]
MLSFFLFLTSFVFADQPGLKSSYVPLYRTKGAQFVSGQETLENLKKGWIGFDFEVWRKISFYERGAYRSLWLPKSHILTLTDIELLPTTSYGPFVTMQHARLRKQRDLTSMAAKILPPGTMLKPLAVGRDWIQVIHEGTPGYLHFSEVTGKMDLAMYGLPKNTKQWLEIDKRIGSMIYFKNGIRKEAYDVEGFAGDHNQGIVLSRDFSKTPELAPLEKKLRLGLIGAVTESQSLRWAQSQLPEQGLVWWKIPSAEPLVPAAETISWSDLLQKNIFSYDFDEKNPTQGIVSADGIYLTEDGQVFKKVESLGALNVPVKISAKGTLVAGPYSASAPKKFSSKPKFKEYIRWHELALQLQGHLGRSPGKLQMKNLEISDSRPDDWTMTLDTGYKVMTLKSFNSGNSWTVTK